jgi:hypothetical protein
MSDSIPKFSYPHEKLTPIVGKPTNATLHTLKQQVYANAVNIECNLGGGLNGYLGIVMPDTEYLTFSDGIPFIKPINPPEPIDDPNKGVDEKHLDKETYKTALAAFTKCKLIEADIKKQLLEAIEHQYLAPLRNAYLGFGRVTPKEILTFMSTKYDVITTDDLSKNMEALSAKWNHEESILLFWERVDECKRIATLGGQPFTDTFIINKMLKVLEDTGVYAPWTTQWRQIHPIETTWNMETFKTTFEYAETERYRIMTTKSAGYHSANATTGTTINNSPSTSSVPPTSTGTGKMSKYVFMGPNGKYISYCWSHGCCANWKHTSATCRTKKEGHKDEATFFDTMGGCQLLNTTSRNQNRNGTSPATVVNTNNN